MTGSHGEIPVTSRGNPRDDSPTPATTYVAGISPCPSSRGNPRDSHGEIPAPCASLNDSSTKKNLLNVSTLNDFNDSTVNEASTVNDARPPADPEAAALARIVESRRAIMFGRQPEPLASGDTLYAAAIDKRYSVPGEKQALEAEIRLLINDPKTGRWLCGFAADLQLVHGQGPRADAPQIYEAMAKLLQEFRDLREVQRRNGQKPYPLGARLNKVVHAICAAHGIATPVQKRLARQAQGATP